VVAVTDEKPSDLYRMAFDEARHRITVESSTLENTRSRIGTLFSAAAIVGALVARPALDNSTASLTAAGKVGLIMSGIWFVFIAVAAVLIWWPVDSTDTLSAQTIIDGYIEGDPPASLAETYRTLATKIDAHANALQYDVAVRLKFFSWAAGAFGAMVLVLPFVVWDSQA